MSEIIREPTETEPTSRKSSQSSSTAESFEKIEQSKETETESEDERSSEPLAEEKTEGDVEKEQDDEAKAEGDEVKTTPVVEVDPIAEDPNAHNQIKEEQKQFYTPEDARKAWSNLILFSIAMMILPLLTMFTSYYWFFLDYLHLPDDQAMLYSGMCGVAVVFVICGLFVWTAYKEEREAEMRLKGSGSKKDD